MNDNERNKRRLKRLQKQKEKREVRSRPGRGPGDAGSDTSAARTWPVGDCWISQTWDTPGSRVDLVFSREHARGDAVVAQFTIDRSGPGVVGAQLRHGVRTEHVVGLAGQLGEASGVALVETTGALVAALVQDAVRNGTAARPPHLADAVALLAGVEPAPFDVPWGPKPLPAERGGLVGRISRWFGG